MPFGRLGVRWTIGDVSVEGFEALRLSIWGATRAFGPDVTYAVCVNSISIERARMLTGAVPEQVRWMDATHTLPAWLRTHFDARLAQGAGWNFAPLQLMPDRYELSLDNDCILWRCPDAVAAWLDDAASGSVLVAEDVCSMLGRFRSLCGDAPRNLGMRGLPPRFDLEAALRDVLRDLDDGVGPLASDLDEQGLQLAALCRRSHLHVVGVAQVSICSPFPPHVPWLGECGAHFCGLNAKSLGWELNGRPAEQYVREHWRAHRPELYERVALTPGASAAAPAEHAPS